jgi:hypothetical protein
MVNLSWIDSLTPIIAIYAALLSTAEVIGRYRDKQSRARVEVSPAFIHDPGPSPTKAVLLVEIVNHGQVRITLANKAALIIQDQHPTDRRKLQLTGYDLSPHPYPYDLEPSTKATSYVLRKKIAQEIAELGLTGTVKVVGEYSDQTGRKYRSKPFSLPVDLWLSTPEALSPQPPPRWRFWERG